MSESELYKELGQLTKDKSKWQESIPYVSSLLVNESVKIQAKALWLLGEMGLEYPLLIRDAVPAIAKFCDSSETLLREGVKCSWEDWKRQLWLDRTILDGLVSLCF